MTTYTIQLPTDFLSIESVFLENQLPYPPNYATTILDSLLYQIAASSITLHTLSEQITVVVSASVFVELISKASEQSITRLVHILRLCILNLYNQNTLYQFSTKDIVTHIIGGRVIIHRQ